jgi:hypothetical protein
MRVRTREWVRRQSCTAFGMTLPCAVGLLLVELSRTRTDFPQLQLSQIPGLLGAEVQWNGKPG